MKFKTCLLLFFIALALPQDIVAGDANGHEEMAATLRFELAEVQAKETELQIRLQQLDDDLKPENIERAFAGVGSTKPEDLREHRRRLLTIERDGVLARLKLLEKSRVRLEAAIETAEAAAYQQSAQSASILTNQWLRTSGAAGAPWFLPAAPDCQAFTNRSNEPGVGQDLNSRPGEFGCGASGTLSFN
jgi:hypothetical protein